MQSTPSPKYHQLGEIINARQPVIFLKKKEEKKACLKEMKSQELYLSSARYHLEGLEII